MQVQRIMQKTSAFYMWIALSRGWGKSEVRFKTQRTPLVSVTLALIDLILPSDKISQITFSRYCQKTGAEATILITAILDRLPLNKIKFTLFLNVSPIR